MKNSFWFWSWRLMRWSGMHETSSFTKLLTFRIQINSFKPFGDFVTEFCQGLSRFADSVVHISSTQDFVANGLRKEAIQAATNRLKAKAHTHKRKKLKSFNSTNGETLYLKIHLHCPVSTAPEKWCELCGIFSESDTGDRSKDKWNFCDFNHCIQSLHNHQNFWTSWYITRDFSYQSSSESSPKKTNL